MTSKERVRMAISHQQPDRVPVDMGGVSVIMDKLKRHLKLDSTFQVPEYFQVDINSVGPRYIGPELPSRVNAQGETETTHWFGYRTKQVWNGVEYNSCDVFYPLDDAETVADVENYNWPDPDWFDYDGVKAQCAANKGKALKIGWPGVYQVATKLRSAEKLYMDMALNPALAQAIFDKMVDFEIEYYGRTLAAAAGQIDILGVCDDYGTQHSLLFGRDMWRKFFARNTRRLTDLAHKHGAYYMQHSCGAIRPIIPELIDCGVDILDPIQKVSGMEPEGLKQDFGSHLTFHGGIDTQGVLPLGTPEQVRRETEHFIEVLHQDGGYILAPSQTLEGDVPVENIIALYTTNRS